MRDSEQHPLQLSTLQIKIGSMTYYPTKIEGVVTYDCLESSSLGLEFKRPTFHFLASVAKSEDFRYFFIHRIYNFRRVTCRVPRGEKCTGQGNHGNVTTAFFQGIVGRRKTSKRYDKEAAFFCIKIGGPKKKGRSTHTLYPFTLDTSPITVLRRARNEG